jgi:uncharacterized SAM-binding protein YcdF (DUF218 family)
MRTVLAVAVVAASAAVAAVLFAGRVLVVADPIPAHADAIVMLAGSIADRALETADLYRAGVAPRVVVTRERITPGDLPLRARGVQLPQPYEMTLDALARLGVPPSATTLLRRRTFSTESEARTIARWACTAHVRRLVVVTSPYHTRRARLILRQALGPGIELAMRPSRAGAFSPARWWRVRRDAKFVLTEYQKLLHYWLKERWTIEPCGGLARSRRG